MNGQGNTKRRISAQRLPVSLPLPRAVPSRNAPQAAFLAQMLTSAPATEIAQRTADLGKRAADAAYRRAETSDLKRIPAGYRKAVEA